jgi:D-alanyl-D-alanine carboxypeptidase
MFERTRTLGRALTGLALLVLALASGPTPADAHSHHGQRGHRSWHARAAMPAGATDPVKDAALILDGETGRVIFARNADAERHPASLTKMMTLYLLFESMKRGDVNLQTMFPISEHAASQRPTNLHLYVGDSISVETAINAIVVRSANDVAVAIAEALGGTEGHFAELMTAKARALGMHDTFYHNASGLPDELQITTANDLSVLARHLAYDFPQYFPYFATPAFTFRGTTYVTHDNLIGRYDGADGIKTGYTGASGFNLVSSVVRNNAHVIGIVMGGRTARRRDAEMIRLLDAAFVEIGHNPTLVAHNGVPWRQVAVNLPAVPSGINVAPQTRGGDDEDSAESAPDNELGNDTNLIAAPAVPVPHTNALVTAPAPVPPPVIAPQPHPVVAQALPVFPPMKTVNVPKPSAKPFRVAANVPTPKPRPVATPTPTSKPDLRADAGEGDFDDAGVPAFRSKGPAWTIQIGAFADMDQARGELEAYAKKSMDVLGQAARIVIPFAGVDGHTRFRARFGPFAEREARQVCERLSQRGQTCFAVLASAR